MNANVKTALFTLAVVGIALLALIPVAWAIIYFGIYIGYGNYRVRGHQAFAQNGVSQIEPACQMEKLFGKCSHHIVYTGSDSVSTWDTVAFFGGRYQLTMQVPVEIQSSTQGKTIGPPRFQLLEISHVTISASGQVGAAFSRQLELGEKEWQTVYDADGDFSAIGFAIKKGPPVENIDAYVNVSR